MAGDSGVAKQVWLLAVFVAGVLEVFAVGSQGPAGNT